eukprot:scaffold29326_cov34-Prasinocladus_malaysianus.AAC.1
MSPGRVRLCLVEVKVGQVCRPASALQNLSPAYRTACRCSSDYGTSDKPHATVACGLPRASRLAPHALRTQRSNRMFLAQP